MVGLLSIQSLVWVSTKAADEPDDLLQAYFVQPTIGEVIPPDSYFDIQAMLSADTDSDFSTVYFNLSNPEENIDLNFETFLSDNSVWQSINYVDTSQLPGGTYYLSAEAHIYVNGNLVDSWQSVPQVLDIAGGTEMAAPGDQQANAARFIVYEPIEGVVLTHQGGLTVKASGNIYVSGMYFVLLNDNLEEIDRVGGGSIDDPENPDGSDYFSWIADFNLNYLENGTYHIAVNIDDYILEHPDILIELTGVSFVLDVPPLDDPLEGTIISPTTEQVSGVVDITVEFSEPLIAGTLVEANIMTSTETVVTLHMSSDDTIQYLADWDTTGLDNGPYELRIFVDNDEIVSKEVIVDNIIESAITMVQPDTGDTIRSDSFQVEFITNFLADDFTVEFISNDDASITTGIILIDTTDGYSWVTTINLNDIFIDGSYSLFTRTFNEDLPNGSMATQFSFILLDREEDDPPIPPEVPEDIILGLSNPGSNLADLIDLQATANYPNLDIDFVFSNSTDQEEILRLPATYFEDVYVANFDTSLLVNNNYYLLASTIFDDVVIDSDSILVTIFNTIEEGELCGDGEVNQTEEQCDDGNNENEDGCSEFCMLEEGPSCGDGEINQDIEECDDGNDNDNDDCSNECLLIEETYCGDGEINQDIEECDDGNDNDNDDCSNECLLIEETPYTPPANGGGDGDSVVIYDLDTTCLEVGIVDEVTCLHFLSLLSGSIDPICLEQTIYDPIACEDYLNIIYVDPECQEADIIDREQCKDYLLEKYVGSVDCQLDDQALCSSILRDEYLNRLVVEVNHQNIITDTVESLLGQNVNLQDLGNQLEDNGLDKNILPLVPDVGTQILLANSQDEIILENRELLTVLNSAVLIIDTDGDGLPDDLEEYYGTDIYNSDSDGDGYTDAEEIQNGYSPNGDGRLEIARTVFDEIILSNIPLKQPKFAPLNVDNSLTVKEVVNVDDKIRLNGQAEPDTWVNIYLYSDLPLVMTTKTDANGNWSYTIQKSLQDEHHRVYVTVNSMTGKVVKQSAPTSFLVKSAKAVTADDYFDTATTADATSNMIFYYIAGAILLIIIGLGVILLLNRRRPDNLGV